MNSPTENPGSAISDRPSRRLRALGFLALGAALALVRIALPVGVGLFLGVLLAFTLQPLYERLRARRWRPGWAALACTLGATTLIALLISGTVTLVVARGASLATALPALVGPGGALRRSFEEHAGKLEWFRIVPADLPAKLEDAAVALGSRAAELAAKAAGATFAALLTVLFMALASYFVLRNWGELVARAESLLPFEPRHTHALLDQFRRVGRQVLRGTVVTGLVQGVLAGIGYAIGGVAEPVLFGALTAVASLIPAVGTMLLWVPTGIGLIVFGHTAAGVFVLLWGAAVVVGVSDYVIRPRLVGGGEQRIPSVLTFMSLFGGVDLFGLVGLILGPVLVTLSLAIIRTYDAEVRAAALRTGRTCETESTFEGPPASTSSSTLTLGRTRATPRT